MKIKLNDSNLTLLLPKDYEWVENGAELFDEMYHNRKLRDIQMFHNIASESYGNIVIGHIDKNDAMPFGNKEDLIKQVHDTLEDNQGIIEVDTGENPRGYEYIYSIIKTYHQEKLNVNYCLRLDIKNGDELIEVNATFFENRMTGQRGSFALPMAWSAGLERDEDKGLPIGWIEDPYDPEYDKGCLMIMAERRGLDGLFPGDPLSQARELLLALTEDSYYKTREEIEAESDDKEAKKNPKEEDKEIAEPKDGDEEEQEKTLKDLFSNDVTRAGAYKVNIDDDEIIGEPKRKFSLNPVEIAKAALDAVDDVKDTIAKTASEFDRVKTPFEIPDEFRCKLNQPVPKEMPGWGKRKYIGFGKRTYAMSAVLLSWPVTETESLSLTDNKTLINQLYEGMNDNEGLIYAKTGITPEGNRYAYALRKMAETDDEGGRWLSGYVLNLNIRIDGRIHFINGSFSVPEDFVNVRLSALSLMALGSREIKLTTDQWTRDPYDADRQDGFLMNWMEDEKYDELFPYSPLSELRSFVDYVVSNN